MSQTVLVAGGTGNLGERIVHTLVRKGADVRVLVRPTSDPAKIKQLEALGAKIYVADMTDLAAVTAACVGANCVVSALSGLREVIVDTQKVLLDAAIAAGVPRFIPSDYSLDFTNLPAGGNRNLDLRREFHTYLDKAPIAATTVFNGAFADMLTGQMPLVLFNLKKVLYWGNADQRMDFTTIENTAEFAANAALDPATPRFLRIAGSQLSAREIKVIAGDLAAQPYGMLRPGGLGLLGVIIKIARTIAPGGQDLYPAWQGMQYMHNMLDGRAKMKDTDNSRYPDIQWTTVKDVLSAHMHQG